MNVLFVINHNSSDQVINLIFDSDFTALDIAKIIVFNNGFELKESDRVSIRNAALTRDLEIAFYEADNRGYGAAVNECVTLLRSFAPSSQYAFFSNADLSFTASTNSIPYTSANIVGFPLYENTRFIVSKINIFTPLLPFKLRKYLLPSVPKYGVTQMVHGCFFGINVEFIQKNKLFFDEKYFLYWEESDFFYKLSKEGFKSIISDSVIINHAGKKSVLSNDSRYYMFRNGLYFYGTVVNSKSLMFIWFAMNLLLATFYFLRHRNFPIWYKQGLNDFRAGAYGARRNQQ